MRQIINHFTDDDLYKFTMCCAVIECFPRTQVKYRFNDRDNTVYPPSFAELVAEQIAMLENLRITDEEIAFLRRKCNYIPAWFMSFLRGFRYNRRWVKVRQDEQGNLLIDIEGCWSNTILLEVKLLAIVSELYYMVTGESKRFDYEDYYQRSYAKAKRLIDAGCIFSDFGTRRRASSMLQSKFPKDFNITLTYNN